MRLYIFMNEAIPKSLRLCLFEWGYAYMSEAMPIWMRLYLYEWTPFLSYTYWHEHTLTKKNGTVSCITQCGTDIYQWSASPLWQELFLSPPVFRKWHETLLNFSNAIKVPLYSISGTEFTHKLSWWQAWTHYCVKKIFVGEILEEIQALNEL